MSSAIGYTRLSQESDTSIDRQKRHIREYADENGLTLETIYDDGERSSGFDESREEYQQVRTACSPGRSRRSSSTTSAASPATSTGRCVSSLTCGSTTSRPTPSKRDDSTSPTRCRRLSKFSRPQRARGEEKEIERAREAVQERIDSGHDHGRPKPGYTASTWNG